MYRQTDKNYNDDRIHITADKSLLNSTALIYVLPYESNTDSTTLIINHSASEYTELAIVKESFDGSLQPVKAGDIVSNRVAIFRINQFNKEQLILLNSVTSGTASFNKLSVGEAIFNVPPYIIGENNTKHKVASVKDLEDMLNEIKSLYQAKIHVSTESPEEYFNNHSLQSGTIYVQVEDELQIEVEDE